MKDKCEISVDYTTFRCSFIANVHKLKGRDNYANWSFAVQTFLVLEGFEKCMEKVVPEEDATAKAKIILSIDSSLFVHVNDTKTGKNVLTIQLV